MRTVAERWARTGAGVGLSALLLFPSVGCNSLRRIMPSRRSMAADGLLAPRVIVPPPYSEPLPPPPPVLPEPPVVAVPGPPPPAPVHPPSAPQPIVVEPLQPDTPGVNLPPPVESKLLTHAVAKGDSLWSISVMYGVSHHELASYNGMKLEDTLKVGRVLRIPPGGQYIPPEKRPKFKSKKKKAPSAPETKRKTGPSPKVAREALPADGTYSVKPGDSLWTISRRFGVKIDDIRSANQLKSDLLSIGQLLMLPKSKSAPPPPKKPGEPGAKTDGKQKETAPAAPGKKADKPEAKAATTTPPKTTLPVKTTLPGVKTLEHEVGAGETLKSIAAMYEVKVEAIKKANPQVKADSDLAPNKILIIPYE